MVDDLANIEVGRDLAVLEGGPPDHGSFSAMTGIQMANNNITPKMPMATMELKHR